MDLVEVDAVGARRRESSTCPPRATGTGPRASSRRYEPTRRRRSPPARLAGLLADSLDADPLFRDLLSDTAATLEHNVSLDAVRTYKEASTSAVHTLTAALTGPHTGLGAEAAQDLILATALLAASTWTATHPSATLVELNRTSPEPGALAADFAPEPARLLTPVVRGLRAPA
ncbi:hypothetical protein [Streptomyces anatolicus]|uniref:hypothetical protein n=1 Tax=Streptomyces anatolicus TaxID=2675858 RepID=UPI0027E01A9A|nr:hypothetical protein [Streptomyces anatolicus]